MSRAFDYVLVTPAKNEERHIEQTIRSVLLQTVLPKRWVIVSDGSSDGTDGIVEKYASANPFIVLVRKEAEPSRNFGSKAIATKLGVQRCADLNYDYVGLMDADVSFDPDFFEKVLTAMNAVPQLGIGGAAVHELVRGRWVREPASYHRSVGGQMQMFRRACYDGIGGYLPLRLGGVDAVAEVMARMQGWQVRSFEDVTLFQHRTVGTAERTALQAAFRQGRMRHANGYLAVFEFLRFFSQLSARPYVLGSACRLVGYFWAMIRNEPPAVPAEVSRYFRQEQWQRIKSVFSGQKNHK